MIRLDRRDRQEAEDMLKWVFQNSFWSGVIRSGGNFRDKYEKIRTQFKQKDILDGSVRLV
jgi:hypothetical protein